MDDSDSPSARTNLLVRIRDPHDGASSRAFVDPYAPLVHAHGRRKGLQEADAADLTQEVLAEVARSIRNFDYQPERGRFQDWLGTLAYRPAREDPGQEGERPHAGRRLLRG